MTVTCQQTQSTVSICPFRMACAPVYISRREVRILPTLAASSRITKPSARTDNLSDLKKLSLRITP